jgi:hypothetical protein
VKTLERNRIDEIVRELESGAYRLALERGVEPPSAERILLEAFGSLAPSLPRTARIVELREKLYACVRRRVPRQEWVLATPASPSATSATVSESLHLRIVDLLEEHQADEPVGRRRALLAGFMGVALVVALIAFLRVHADALAAAQPTINELSGIERRVGRLKAEGGRTLRPAAELHPDVSAQRSGTATRWWRSMPGCTCRLDTSSFSRPITTAVSTTSVTSKSAGR